jgi:Mrp family chromosome partitioning ATPase
MREFLDHQKQVYDHIIIDGPPALVLTDAKILANFTDGTLIVVHAEDTPRGVVQRMLRELRSGNVRILGVLLNAVLPRRGGYFQESYERYYDYIGSETAAALPNGKKV